MIPQLDARRIAAREPRTMRVLARALRDPGVFTLTDTAITPLRMRAVMDACRALFDPSWPESRAGDGSTVGIAPQPVASGAGGPETPPRGTAEGRVPDTPPVGAGTLPPWADAYRRDATAVAAALLRATAAALDAAPAAPTDAIARAFEAPPIGTLRARFDPPAQQDRPRRAPDLPGRATAAGTDCGCLTLIATDGTPAVEVRTPEGWRRVVAPPGVFIVTFGEMLAHWTEGAVRAAPRRMRSTPDAQLALALAVDPMPDTVVSPKGSNASVRAREFLEGCETARDGVEDAAGWLRLPDMEGNSGV